MKNPLRIFQNKKLAGTLLIFGSGFQLALWMMVLPSIWYFMQAKMGVTLNPSLMQVIPFWGLFQSIFLFYVGWKDINKEIKQMGFEAHKEMVEDD